VNVQLTFDGIPDLSPLVGLKLKLERAADIKDVCCKGMGIVHPGKGPHAAELRCSGCGKHRGWLDKPTVNRLLDVLAHFPEARNDVHVIRDQKK
jgi:hypothetical protein